ncbi:monomeric sarcosine oxidase [Parasteatoda tepidariorum]|uniref:monomeric sarcosine oxidase n=1 Tax=Parasteatoda tepidariorum TaxID=114398 RepID=UPI000A2C0944|nr:monomeric sarcosine oxidase [Parasteatoda tepidariorum]
MALYDLCVIGGGMFGSAAARHASANPALKVCLIGPPEPTPEEMKTRDIFSSYYDAGRITRVLDEDPACEVLSRQSIKRYHEIEKLSGIKFHTPVGCLFIVQKNIPEVKALLQAADAKNVSITDVSSKDTFTRRYPYLNLKDDEIALLDDNGGGHIDPRKLVAAQKKISKLQGCDIIEGIVTNLKQENNHYQVKTEAGNTITSKRVLIATGAFINLKMHSDLKPLIATKYKETVALFEIPENEVKRLSSLPDVIHVRGSDKSFPNGIGTYFLPPIKYPNGKFYIKIGVDGCSEEAKDLDDIKKWYQSDGDRKLIELEEKLIKMDLPGLKYDSVSSRTCVNCYTPNGLPYIDRINPTLTVAVAGNGKGAKFSDEVGRLAAKLSMTGEWDSELEQIRFRAIFQ